ncbi:MAG: hypothetical protein U0231_09035 [Nitrospiraceae bacterium]
MAKSAMQSLIKTGRVARFLGAGTQDVTPLLAKVFHLPDVKGSIVTDLQSKGSGTGQLKGRRGRAVRRARYYG